MGPKKGGTTTKPKDTFFTMISKKSVVFWDPTYQDYKSYRTFNPETREETQLPTDKFVRVTEMSKEDIVKNYVYGSKLGVQE